MAAKVAAGRIVGRETISVRRAMRDSVDSHVELWSTELRWMDPVKEAIFARLGIVERHARLSRLDVLGSGGLRRWRFKILLALRRCGAPYTESPSWPACCESWSLPSRGSEREQTPIRHRTRLLEEDPTMSDHTPEPGNSGDQSGSEPEATDDAREAAMMRAVMRAQKKHREGGIDPELDELDTDPGPAT
jgi:hypothetical protein